MERGTQAQAEAEVARLMAANHQKNEPPDYFMTHGAHVDPHTYSIVFWNGMAWTTLPGSEQTAVRYVVPSPEPRKRR